MSTFTLHGNSPAVRSQARTAATCVITPALSSAVPRPKSRPSCSRGSNGSLDQRADVPGRLHVVVRVEQHGGRVGAVGPLADDVGETAVDAELAHVVEPGVAHELGDGRRARVDVVEVIGVGADARDADQGLELALRGVEVLVRGCDRGVGVHARGA